MRKEKGCRKGEELKVETAELVEDWFMDSIFLTDGCLCVREANCSMRSRKDSLQLQPLC